MFYSHHFSAYEPCQIDRWKGVPHNTSHVQDVSDPIAGFETENHRTIVGFH